MILVVLLLFEILKKIKIVEELINLYLLFLFVIMSLKIKKKKSSKKVRKKNKSLIKYS
jgi:hypothetical protein